MTQQFVGGDMAARLIGMSYKTLKKRYDEGWIAGERTPQNKLRFTLDEVERAKNAWEDERSQPMTAAQLMELLEPPRKERLFQDLSRSDLEKEITELRLEIAILKERVSSLEQMALPQSKPFVFKVAGTEPQSNLPEGCVLASKFAEEHGVKRSTFRGHVEDGIGPSKEKIETTNRKKPGRPREVERLLDPEQQAKALEFWDRHGVSHH